MRRSKSSSGERHPHTSSTVTSSTIPANSSVMNVAAEAKSKEMLKELTTLVRQVQEERSRGEHNLQNISKTHERMQQETKISSYYKSKLKGLYTTAMQDAESEGELIQKALDRISEIKGVKVKRDGPPKQGMRRGVLMSMLVQKAQTLPLWVGKSNEMPPPLCGAMSHDCNYIANSEDMVAARVKSQDGEENWILAEVVQFNQSSNKYDVDDIDAEEGRERHTLSRRRIVPLPIWKANPETDEEALFTKNTLVLALYPQTTCFYRALIHEAPRRSQEDYSVLFEDTSYPDGYSPPLCVAQRYVILCKEDKKK